MKKHFQKTLFLMLVALLSMNFVSCSKDDDNEPGQEATQGNSLMYGWFEVDGTKYEFHYFYGSTNDDGSEMGFTGFNKDPYKFGENETYNMANISLAFNPDGTLAYEDRYQRLCFDFEFDLNCTPSNTDTNSGDMVMFSSFDTPLDGITATRSGNKVTIDGRNVIARHGQKGAGSVRPNDPTTTINFHFEGTPQWIEGM